MIISQVKLLPFDISGFLSILFLFIIVKIFSNKKFEIILKKLNNPNKAGQRLNFSGGIGLRLLILPV